MFLGLSSELWLHNVFKSSYFTTHQTDRGVLFRLQEEKTDEIKWEKTVAYNEKAIGFTDKYLTMSFDNGSYENRDLKVFDLESGACVFTTKSQR